MGFFRRVPETFFKPERAAELLPFSELALKHAHAKGYAADYLVDVIVENPTLWEECLLETWDPKTNFDGKGGLDILAACMAEGLPVEDVWEHVAWANFNDSKHGLALNGLHGIHFRMNLNDPNQRVEYTLKMAEELYDRSHDSIFCGAGPLNGLSVLHVDRNAKLGELLASGVVDEYDHINFTERDFKLLLGDEVDLPDDEIEASLALAVDKLLRGSDNYVSLVKRDNLAHRIERALFPMVYNYGYRLKAEGVCSQDVISKVSRNMDALLVRMNLTAEFEMALQRQILINLFSAFPEDLYLFDAKTDELQGVLMNPVLSNHEDSSLFINTLAGPLRIFSAESTTRPAERGFQIISFLRDHEISLDFGRAIKGHLAQTNGILSLAHGCDFYSKALDDSLCNDDQQIIINRSLIDILVMPKQLALYSDKAVLCLIDHAIGGSSDPRKHKIVSISLGQHSVAPIFKERPHLREPMLDILVQLDKLDKDTFQWFGFGHKELRKLGARAPYELKKAVLEDDLGL